MQYYSFLLKGKSIFVTFNAYRKQIEHERSESGYIQRGYNDLYHLFLSFDMVGRCQGRHIWRKLDYRDILCNGNRVLYSRSLIFPVIGKTVSDLFEGPDKKSRDPLLEVCIGLFSGCCVSLLEVGRDNTVEWLYILCVLYPYGRISIIWSYLVYSALLDHISLSSLFMPDDSPV